MQQVVYAPDAATRVLIDLQPNQILNQQDTDKWYFGEGGTPGGRLLASTVEDLTDVSVSGLASGQVLQWSGSAWVNVTPSGGTLTDIHYTGLLFDSSDDEPGNNKTTLPAGLVAGFGTQEGRILENKGTEDTWMGPRTSFEFRIPALALYFTSTNDVFSFSVPHEMYIDEVSFSVVESKAADMNFGLRVNAANDVLDDGSGNNYLTILSGGTDTTNAFRDGSNQPITTASIVLDSGTGHILRSDIISVLTGPLAGPPDDVICVVSGRLLETPKS